MQWSPGLHPANPAGVLQFGFHRGTAQWHRPPALVQSPWGSGLDQASHWGEGLQEGLAGLEAQLQQPGKGLRLHKPSGGGGGAVPSPLPASSSLWSPRCCGLPPPRPVGLARHTHLTWARAPGSCHAVHRASSRHGEPGMGTGEAGRRPRCWSGSQGPAAPRARPGRAPSAAPREELLGGRGSAAPSLPPGRLRLYPDK